MSQQTLTEPPIQRLWSRHSHHLHVECVQAHKTKLDNMLLDQEWVSEKARKEVKEVHNCILHFGSSRALP